jgi:ABC-type branched-subunit amino acid transport system substrate-binding protein
MRIVRTAAAFALLGLACSIGQGECARATDEVVLGMSAAFSGPASALGNDMRAGITAAIEECNRAGGVHGRNVRLAALDDGYEPARAAPNMRRLVDEEKVVAIVGNVGTPTAGGG